MTFGKPLQMNDILEKIIKMDVGILLGCAFDRWEGVKIWQHSI